MLSKNYKVDEEGELRQKNTGRTLKQEYERERVLNLRRKNRQLDLLLKATTGDLISRTFVIQQIQTANARLLTTLLRIGRTVAPRVVDAVINPTVDRAAKTLAVATIVEQEVRDALIQLARAHGVVLDEVPEPEIPHLEDERSSSGRSNQKSADEPAQRKRTASANGQRRINADVKPSTEVERRTSVAGSKALDAFFAGRSTASAAHSANGRSAVR